MEQTLKEIMPPDCPGDFNQALMELGAVICVPNGQPKMSGSVPVQKLCRAHLRDTTEEIPVKAPKKARKIGTQNSVCDPGRREDCHTEKAG